MSRKHRRTVDLSSDDVQSASRRLRAELAKRVDPVTGPKPEWEASFEALPANARRQLLDEVRAFAQLLCSRTAVAPAPLQIGDGAILASAVEKALAKGGVL